MVNNARLILCEQSPRWSVRLRWLMGRSGVRLVEAGSLDECWQELARAPASCLALEATAENIEALVAGLLELRPRYPAAAAVVFCERQCADMEWLVREAGAAHVASSTHQLTLALRVIRRHLAAESAVGSDLRQSVWQKLPWEE